MLAYTQPQTSELTDKLTWHRCSSREWVTNRIPHHDNGLTIDKEELSFCIYANTYNVYLQCDLFEYDTKGNLTRQSTYDIGCFKERSHAQFYADYVLAAWQQFANLRVLPLLKDV